MDGTINYSTVYNLDTKVLETQVCADTTYSHEDVNSKKKDKDF